MHDDVTKPHDAPLGADGPPTGRSSDRPPHDAAEVLLRLLVGSAAAGTDAVLRSVWPVATGGGDSPEDREAGHGATLARQALIGLLFEAYGVARRGASSAGRAGATLTRSWSAVLGPVLGGRLFAPVRAPVGYVLGRGSEELQRWARIGRVEEQRSRELACRLLTAPLDEVVARLRRNPELERLVQAQARALLARLGDDPQLAALIREQGDRYVDHLHEKPEAIQELVRGQSAGLVEDVANAVRRRTVSADWLLERFVRTVLRRRPREQLPEPSPEVQARAPGKPIR